MHVAKTIFLSVAAAMLFLAPPTLLAGTFSVVDLGSLGGSVTTAHAINNSGTVVGASKTASGLTHAFSYANGTMTDLGALVAGIFDYSEAFGINDSGQVVGTSYTPGGLHAFVASNGSMTDLGTLDPIYEYSKAAAINNGGTIVGSSFVIDYDHTSAFSYRDGVMTSLGTLGGNVSHAFGINDAGTVVGYSSLVGEGYIHAFSYSNGVMTDLTAINQRFRSATAINHAGTIVGHDNYFSSHALVYDQGVVTDLGTLGGQTSRAQDINDAGAIVGYSEVAGGARHAFSYYGGTLTDLNSLVDLPAGVYLNDAQGINNQGQIIATGNNGRSYLLTDASASVPEPVSTLALLAILFPGLVAISRRNFSASAVKISAPST